MRKVRGVRARSARTIVSLSHIITRMLDLYYKKITRTPTLECTLEYYEKTDRIEGRKDGVGVAELARDRFGISIVSLSHIITRMSLICLQENHSNTNA